MISTLRWLVASQGTAKELYTRQRDTWAHQGCVVLTPGWCSMGNGTESWALRNKLEVTRSNGRRSKKGKTQGRGRTGQQRWIVFHGFRLGEGKVLREDARKVHAPQGSWALLNQARTLLWEQWETTEDVQQGSDTVEFATWKDHGWLRSGVWVGGRGEERRTS